MRGASAPAAGRSEPHGKPRVVWTEEAEEQLTAIPSEETVGQLLALAAGLTRFSQRGRHVPGLELHAVVRELLGRRLRRLPGQNPCSMFGEWLAAELPAIVGSSAERYHAYAFATVRQAGAAFELAQSFIGWALPGEPAAGTASEALRRQVDGAKVLLLKLARQRVFDTTRRGRHPDSRRADCRLRRRRGRPRPGAARIGGGDGAGLFRHARRTAPIRRVLASAHG